MLKLMLIACPLHCGVAAADKQATKVCPRSSGVALTNLAKRSSATVVVRLHLPCMTAARIPRSPFKKNKRKEKHYDALQQLGCLLPQDTHTHNTHTHGMRVCCVCPGGGGNRVAAGHRSFFFGGGQVRYSCCCHHAIPTSAATCQSAAPPHRLSTRTPTGPPVSRRIVPSGWTLDTGGTLDAGH